MMLSNYPTWKILKKLISDFEDDICKFITSFLRIKTPDVVWLTWLFSFTFTADARTLERNYMRVCQKQNVSLKADNI